MALSTSAHNTQIIYNTFKLIWSYNSVENLMREAFNKTSNMNEKVPQDEWKSFWTFSKTITDNKMGVAALPSLNQLHAETLEMKISIMEKYNQVKKTCTTG